MQRICAAVVMAMSMGIVTPQVGVTQDASTLSATRLADTPGWPPAAPESSSPSER